MTTPDTAQDIVPGPAGPRLNAIGVVVADMTKAVAFYERLGLTFPPDARTESHVSAPLGGGFALMLDTEEMIRGIYPDWSGEPGSRMALAVELPSAAQVDRLYAELEADGYGHRAPWNAFWGQRYASLLDPDGTTVDLYAEIPAPPEA